jgi:hypothetical protein
MDNPDMSWTSNHTVRIFCDEKGSGGCWSDTDAVTDVELVEYSVKEFNREEGWVVLEKR